MDETVNRKLQRQIEEDPILEAATDWFVELQDAGTRVERMLEWQRWLMSDERHRAAYKSIESLWSSVEEVDSQLWPAPEDVRSDRYDPHTSISAWRARRVSAVRHFALAASVVVALTLVVSQWSTVRNWLSPSAVAVETHTGERREIRLSDGSTVTVGGRSQVSASLTAHTRAIELDSGEAFFEVAKDRKRPFIVRAGGTVVTAIGTQFNVRRVADGTIVSVAEGVVQVDRAIAPLSSLGPDKSASTGFRLVAGQQLSITKTGAVDAPQTVDTGAVGGWRTGQLHYLDEPLELVVADVRRYAARDIEIADQSIGRLRVTGTVFENDVESWLRTLETAFPIRATTAADGKIVLNSAVGDR